LPGLKFNKTNGISTKKNDIQNNEFMTGNFSSIYMSRNRVRSWNEPSFTIQAGGRHAPLHPDAPIMIKVGKDKMKFNQKFLSKYKNHPRRDYAYYLLALSHYDQIVDETKDLNEILRAKKYFEIILQKYPNTEFAIDSEYKLELIEEILASKEMYLARYYVDREKWIPAINRFKKVVKDYDETIYVEEALHRLVELHYKVGLIEESKKYAVLLGYNYQSSEWYEESYKVLNKDYAKISKKKEKDKDQSLIKKFKDLLK